MTRYPRTLLLALLVAPVPVLAVGLPDTGQDTCYNDTVADSRPAAATDSIARDTGTHPRQDCRYGRDAAYAIGALTKTGAGAKGFDYMKVTNLGIATADPSIPLGTAYTDWGCTLDNVTGLMWEVKPPPTLTCAIPAIPTLGATATAAPTAAIPATMALTPATPP